MSWNFKKRPVALALFAGLLMLSLPQDSLACNGTDSAFSENPALEAFSSSKGQNGTSYFSDTGKLLLPAEVPKITPALAKAIAEKYVTENYEAPPLPLTFRKLEIVHNKLIYQFRSQTIPGMNNKYHLGPVNFTVDFLVLDVDALTGNMYVANGCGAAPGQLLYTYNPLDFQSATLDHEVVLASNNTNFVARKTGNTIKVDGIIDPEEWKDTGHKYFYLGDGPPHQPWEMHKKASYQVEVWAQIDENNIYFAIRTDTPYWVAIMLKEDPNLGMLPAYRNALLFSSVDGVSDRHFTQREDKTFFLKRDDFEHVNESSAKQDDLYTYEASFPLDSGDKQDVALKPGKAYNILLVVGNTLEHFGIFTTDDAHKTHDHSKNNKEHVNVWSSTETTLRIGSPQKKDIFGAALANPVSEFTSGYDEAKSKAHFHYAQKPLKVFPARASLSFAAGTSAAGFGVFAMGFMFLRLRKQNGTHTVAAGCGAKKDGKTTSPGLDLLKGSRVRRLVTSKHFRTFFILPTLLIFTAVVVLGLLDVQDGRRNIATVYTWTLWWTMIIFSFIVMGRWWCMMCPFAVVGDFVQKYVSFNKKLPARLQNMGVQALGFTVLTLLFTLMSFQSRPFATAVVILTILTAAVLFSVIYRRRTFCRNLCPVGAVIGLYSTVSPLELAPIDKGKCERHESKDCAAACPMLESPQEGGSNLYCNFCMKCVPACPNKNLTLRLRAAGEELSSEKGKPVVEAVVSLSLLGIIIVETLAMTSSWAPLKLAVGAWLGIPSGTAVYMAVFFAVVLVPLAVFYGLSSLLSFWVGKGKSHAGWIVSQFAFVFIPLGIALHLSHNIQHLLIEGPIALPVTFRLLDKAGLDAAAFLINWNPLPVLGLKPLFFIQMGIVAVGFIFTLTILYRKLMKLKEPLGNLYKYTAAMSLYAITVIITSIYVLGLPMLGRHIH